MSFLRTQARTLERLLDLKSKTNEVFTEDEALHDVMLALDRGRERSLQQWADRWGWAKTTVYRKLDDLMQSAKLQNTDMERRGTGVERHGTQNGQNDPVKAESGTGVERRGTEVERSREKSESARARANSPVFTEDNPVVNTASSKEKTLPKGRSKKKGSSGPDFDAVMESWNSFAAEMGLPAIEKLNRKRRAGIRAKYDEIWPRIDEVYQNIRGSPFLRGEEGRNSWRGANFDFLWVREDNYLRILEGTYGTATRGLDRSGRAVPGSREDEAGIGGEMQGGVPPWLRRRVEGKRDGELSGFEQLIKAGYSLREAAGIAGCPDDDRIRLALEEAGGPLRNITRDPPNILGDGTHHEQRPAANGGQGAGICGVDGPGNRTG